MEQRKKTWQEVHEATVQAATMQSREIPLNTTRVWMLREDGNFGRPDKGFFDVVGVTVFLGNPDEREVPNWDQPMFRERDSGYVLLARDRSTGRLLIQYRSEAGSAGYKHVSAQSFVSVSQSNRDKVHGGKAPKYAEYTFREGLVWYGILQDPARFFKKTDQFAILDVDAEEIPLDDSFFWASKQDLLEMLKDGLIGSHLAQALGVVYLTT